MLLGDIGLETSIINDYSKKIKVNWIYQSVWLHTS